MATWGSEMGGFKLVGWFGFGFGLFRLPWCLGGGKGGVVDWGWGRGVSDGGMWSCDAVVGPGLAVLR